MSIDTLLEAARYLEWQAERDRDRHASADPQPRRLSDEEDQSKVKVLINEEAESKRSEEVSPQPIAANHVNWAERPPRPPGHPRMPFAVVPMVPVVTATPLPLVATLPAGSSGSPQRAPPPSAPHQPPCSPQVNVDGAKQPLRCSSSQQRPQVHVQYPPPVGGVNGPAPQTALASHQALPTSHLGSNGMTLDDMRGAANAKRRSGGTGTREVHNKLEQNRRAHLKECFETLKKNVPNVDDKKTSNLSVLRSALRYIQTLKRKEKEYEHEMERLAREKIATQQRLSELKKELSQRMDAVAIERVIRQTVQPEDDQASTSTASEGEDNLERETDEDAAAPAALREPPPAAPLSPSSSTSRGLRASVPPPTVIARAAVGPRPSTVSHPSVIRAVSRAPPAVHKHLPHIAPSPVPARPVGHVAARLGAPLPSRLPALYPQGVSVSQPAVVGHIAHAFGPPQAGGAVGQQAAAALVKPAAVLAPHPQLVGQAAVTMVTVPTFPVSTIKLA